MKLMQRLAQVEQAARSETVEYRIFRHGELVLCAEHAMCHVEVATGEHHKSVFTLTFGDETRAR
jgi:hypothetical protein